MRQVDAEGDSRGDRGHERAANRSRSRLRRAAIEWLERRELLSTSTSTLPSPTVVIPPGLLANGAANVSSPTLIANGGPSLTDAVVANSPSVSVDPINPLKMVSVWVDHDAAGYQPGGLTQPITNFIEGTYSTDGGQTWNPLDLNSVNIQQDFSETPPTTSFYAFTQTTNASIAFDRGENFYVLSSTHNDANTAGILDLKRFSFAGNNPPAAIGTTPVYSWDKTDSAANAGTVDQVLTPTIAVDTNVPTFTDPTTGASQVDAFSGNIYVAWGEEDSNNYPATEGTFPFNPFTIRMTASSDQGLDFTHDAYVDNSSNANNYEPAGFPLHGSTARYATPQIAISQGNVSGTVKPGQVTIVYDDYGTQAPIDRILDQTDTVGGTSEQFSPPAADLGAGTFATAIINNTTVIVQQNLNTNIPIAVNITDAKFTTLQALDVKTTIDYAAMPDLTVTLTPPAAVNTYLAARDPRYPGFLTLYNRSLTGPNLGATAGSGVRFGAGSGTVFDPEAVRAINDGNVGIDAVGHFAPVSERDFLLLQGLGAAANGNLPGLNGTWNFAASYSPAVDTSTTLRYVNGVTLNFSSGIDPGSTGAEATVADKNTLFISNDPNINPTNPAATKGSVTHTDNQLSPFYDGVAGTYVTGNPNAPITEPTQGPIALLPAPVIASDNTLGSFSQHEGRIYVAFTGAYGSSLLTNTDIFLAFSDDGGQTWSDVNQVNDDNAATDGYSASTAGGPLGRTQYQPQIAVDQSTGAVVLSFLDARNDPSDARVATEIAASNDGAQTFAADVYANPTSTALNAVTGNAVNIGPVPDNESTGGGVHDTSGFGTHQALVVTNGQITAVWSSNQNTNKPQAIVDSILSLSAGPRIISSTQGPVGLAGDVLNASRAADGTTLANTIQVTFDEPVDPGTFATSNVGVFYKSPAGGASVSLPIVSVVPLDANAFGAVNFLITFNPAGLANSQFGLVGTYSYTIYPTGNPNASPVGISDRIRHVIGGGAIASGNVMDQNANGIPGQPHDDDYLVGQPTTVPVKYTATTGLPATIATGTVTSPTMIMSPIVISDEYAIQADNGILPGVTLTLNLASPRDGNIIAYLLAPDGLTRIKLFTRVGGLGANFTNTTLSDLAPTSIDAGVAPFSGSFKPETSFNTLSADGFTAQGTWNLVIENLGGPAATLNGWSLTFQPLQSAYSPGTLPLIVPGPHVSSTVAVDPIAGQQISSGTNNLVLNNTVNTLRVTWDRNVLVGSFTPAQILSILGPAGAVSLAGITIKPVSVFTPAGQMAYTNGLTADVFDITFPTQQLSGTYSLTLGTGVTAQATTAVNAVAAGVDANENAGLDALKGVATNGVSTPVTYTAVSPAVPMAIAPATTNSNGSITPSMLMSPIVVPDDYPLLGDVNGVPGVTLTLNITYPVDPNLIAYLLAPDGKQVRLFTNVGSGTKTANFTTTTFSDTATTLISNAGAPFFGTFKPQQALADLNNPDAENSLGTWNLVIENSGNFTGTLNSWSLTFQKPASGTGLAEFPEDQTHASYQIFNLAASNALANSTWTAVGPAGITTVGATTPVTFATASTVVPAPLAAGTANTPAILATPINIPANLGFAIQGDTATIPGVSLALDLAYNGSNANLAAFLVAPDGKTTIQLFGKGTLTAASGGGLAGSTFSDVGGTFTPTTLFSTLSAAGFFTGGTWTLEIENFGPATGTLDAWTLTFAKPSATFSGAASTIAIDPADRTGNTVYLGAASGGIWKTTNFLTTNPAGPTYVPLTQFGPNFSLNIGSIAIFGRNNDPSRSVIFAGTGFGQETTTSNDGSPNVNLNSGRGVGLIRSTDGGATWTLLDSLVNANPDGSELAESSRDHNFVGDTTYKVVVDPSPELDGQIIVYAALGGPTGGLYRSLDSGDTWQLLQAGNATDVLLDPNSKSPTTGNLDTLYAAFSTAGVFVSTNQGQTLQRMVGQLGKDPLIVGPGFPATPIPVGNAGVTPNFITNSYIVLGRPALTGNAGEDTAYQGWLFAAVENGNGTFNGLYVTKDSGENWTLVQLPNIPGNGSVKASVPTNDTTGVNSYDPTSSKFNQEGAYNLTLTVDPTDPNIVYIGGSQNFQGSGMIRVDLTDLHDAHNFTSFSNNRTDGGLLTVAAQGGVTVTNPANGPAQYVPIVGNPVSQILNLRYAPDNPFNINATLVVANTTNFINDGTGVTWTPFDETLKANAGDPTGSTNIHDVVDYVDPITGEVRLLIADDQGIFTTLVNADGTLDNGIGTDGEANYSRNGNLQDEQLLASAAQPSFVATQAAGALFYASGETNLAAQSAADILTAGDLTWDNSNVLAPPPTSPRNTSANSSIVSSDRGGVGIATDPTGATQSVYEYDIPILGGNLTDFFRVNQNGRTTGLANNVNQEFPNQNYNGDAQVGGYTASVNTAVNNGQIPLGNFEVNPLNGQQILIGSAVGNLYETTNQGVLWSPIGTAANFQVNNTGSFTPIQFSAIAYAAPDPNVSGGVGNLNNFIYVGTSGSALPAGSSASLQVDGLSQNDGRIFVTQAGGKGWTNISKGLDGSSVVGIYPDPDRGSHAAYAVTLTGVYFSPDTVGLAAAGQVVWTDITSNLTSIQYNPFGNAVYQQSVLAPFVGQTPAGPSSDVFTAQYGGFTSIAADYRYEIPSPTNATQGTSIFYPVLYVSGYGGVFRSIDNGVTWTVFPNTAFDAAPVDGGYLPSVDVTNIQLVLGDINPDTGHATQNSNSTIMGATPDPEILLASTFGAGDYAIRLAPDVLPNSVVFDPNQPAPNGSDSSGGAGITNVLDPFLDGVSEVSNFGNTVTINLFDESRNPDGTPTAGFGTLLGTGRTNALGQFVHLDPATGLYDLPGVQVVDSGQDPTFFASSTASDDKVVGIRATDSSGASGNLTMFSYTLDLIAPITPQPPFLESTYDTGRSSSDDLTNLSVPAQAGPGAPLTIVNPTFDVTVDLVLINGVYQEANPLTPNPISLTIELLRATNANGPFFVINQTQTGFINVGGASETYMLTDPTVAAMAQAGIDQTFYYEALQIDEAGNVSQPASNVTSVTVNTIAPPSPTGITLTSNSNTTPPMPAFSVTGILPGDQVLLYRSINGGAPILVGTGAINATNATATLPVTDTLGASPDGVYTYYAVQQDVFGNYSPLSMGSSIVVTINTQTPPATPILEAAYDTGRSNKDDVTDIAVPAPTPGVTPSFVSPVFDVNTVPPTNGQPAIATVQLFRATSAGGPYTMVGSASFNGNPAKVTDGTLQALVAQMFAAGTPVNQLFWYEADQINASGIESSKSAALPILVDTLTPATLPAPGLDASSNTGLNKSQLITNQTKPTFDFANLLPGEQVFLYRSNGGRAPILVGTGIGNISGVPISGTIQDTTGAVPDGVYQYFVVQQDLAGNISNFSPAIAVTVNTSTPIPPTIALLASDDTGLPTHPNVTSVTTPHFVGTAQYNFPTNFPVDLVNVATGQLLTSMHFYPAANGTYEAQITTPLAKGSYTVEARTTNQAGTYSFSAPLTITILPNNLATGPNLMLSPATDTGIKGDGVTANHDPQFIGTTAPGDLVSIYVLVNGVDQGPIASGTSNSISGAFSIQLPSNLTDGTTQLQARTSDIANNLSPFGSPYTVQIVTTAGDFLGVGKAQLAVFDPYNETYYIRGVGSTSIPNPAGEDVPIQYDFNGDGKTDTVGYKYDVATYFGFLSNNSAINTAYGAANQSLPVSGYFGNSGTLLFGSYQPATGNWEIALPQPGGLVVNFGVPRVDIPEPAAYNGFNSTELAVFRNTTIFGGDADSFTVIGPQGAYEVSFTSPRLQQLGFVYKPGDIAAPADYDGVGRDEFAVYRPGTGQFFILNTPVDSNPATWTLRTVTLNLPGGPSVNDVPVSEDYDGDGKADPTVYRPSNSTFYMLQTTTNIQVNIPFGPAGQSIASAGPILYRLNALLFNYATLGGYPSIITTAGGASLGGGLTGGGTLGNGGVGKSIRIESFASPSAVTPSTSSSSANSPLATMTTVAAPLPIATAAATTPSAPTVSSTAPQTPVTVGAPTPRTVVAASAGSTKAATTTKGHAKKAAKPLIVDTKTHEAEAKAKADHAKAHAKAPAQVEVKAPAKSSSKSAEAKSHATAAAMAATSLQHLVMAKKGGKVKKG